MIFKGNIKGKPVSNTLVRISKSIESSLSQVSDILTFSRKLDVASTADIIEPPVSMEDCLFVFDNSYIVAKVCRILAQDLLLGNITLNSVNPEDKEKVAKIQENLLLYRKQLYFSGIDYFYAPMGLFEVAWDEEVNNSFVITQIPVTTTQLLQIPINDESYFLIAQESEDDINYFKIMGEKYPEDFDTFDNKELGYVVIFGGDNFFKFYRKPEWLQAKKAVFADIAIDERNEQQVENGNIAQGILNINLEPKVGQNLVPKTNLAGEAQRDEDGNIIMELEPDEEDVIDEEIEDKDGGIAVIYTRSERPISLDFVDIEAKGNKELEKLHEKAEYKVLSSYNVPKIRLGIMDEKQSMNSTRDQTIWDIYTIDLGTFLTVFTDPIKNFIYELFEIEVDVDIGTPVFSDKKEIELKIVLELWNNGILNLKQTIKAASEYIEVIDLDDYDFTTNTGLWDMRCYNGQPFGEYDLTDEELEQFNQINSIIDDQV